MKRQANIWDDIVSGAVAKVIEAYGRDPMEILGWEYIDELLDDISVNPSYYAPKLADAMWDMMHGRILMTEQERQEKEEREKKQMDLWQREERISKLICGWS